MIAGNSLTPAILAWHITAPPVFDGMMAFNGNLLIATTDGRVVCMGGNP